MRRWVTLLALLGPVLAQADDLHGEAREALVLAPWLTGLGQVTDFRFLPEGGVVLIEKDGVVRARVGTRPLKVAARLSVDDASEKGGLGLELHPDFAKNRVLFLYYSASEKIGGTDEDRHRVSSFVLKPDGTIDLSQEKILVRGLRGPANHDGGALAVGPDKKLYIGVGDTGCNSGARPGGRIGNYFATCLTNGNGKILRVELDGSIPSDNPLVGVESATACGQTCRQSVLNGPLAAPRKDLWAWGFRNPWRFWFDPKTGHLWVGDVGEVTNEEVTIAKKGRHHGWPFREGAAGQPSSRCKEIRPDTGDCVDPIYTCKHGKTQGGVDGDCGSITGGVIVDHCTWPARLRDRYYFADNANGALFSLAVTPARDGVVPGSRMDVGHVGSGLPVSLHLGPEGDLYVAALPGSILRISPKKREVCAKRQ
jgi:glucose/arabinose dehydrogenase